MTDDDPFEGPRLLIEGARKDVNDLDRGTKAFFAGHKPMPVNERDPKTGEHVAKLRFLHKLPGSLRVSASNALNNLRHALDHAVNTASVQLGGRDTNYFPFAKDAVDFERVLKDNCKTVPASLIPTLEAFKPYPAGDDLLAILRTAGKNKHRELLDLAPELVGVNLTINRLVASGTGSFGGFRWNPEKREVEFARLHSGGKLEADLQGKLAFRILLRHAPTPNAQPAQAVLYALADKVESILLALEAETARLKAL